MSVRRKLLFVLAASLVGLALPPAPERIRFKLVKQELVEQRLKEFSRSNSEREAIVKQRLAQAGCKDSNLSEQPIERKLPPNVICVVPGESDSEIVVGAHTDHVLDFGEGVIDNWSSAALLPSLLESLNVARRHHTFVFIGFSAEEKGMLGSQYYAEHLTAEQRTHIAAMINMDSLGLGPTKVWSTHADPALLDDLNFVAATMNLPVATVNVEKVGTTDSESFATYNIPRITLLSVTQQTWRILHSSNDRLAAVKMGDYYNSYKLIAAYLAYLDEELKPAANAEKAGH